MEMPLSLQKLRDHQSYYNSSWGWDECLSQISWQMNLMVEKKSQEITTRLILWGPWKSVPNFTVIHPTVVEIFQCGPKWWTDQKCHPESHVARVATNYNYICSPKICSIWFKLVQQNTKTSAAANLGTLLLLIGLRNLCIFIVMEMEIFLISHIISRTTDANLLKDRIQTNTNYLYIKKAEIDAHPACVNNQN